MSFASYSLDPTLNGTLGGLDVSENCNPANINNGLRQLMADGKQLSDTVAAIDISSKANLNGPAFTGQPTFSGRGAFLHHNNAANASGRVFIQAAGAAVPTMANGDILLTY